MRLLATAAVLLSSSLAAAQAPGQTMSWDAEDPNPRPALTQTVQTERVSYRGQIIAADVLSLAAMTLGPASGNEKLAGLGVYGYFFAAPIVHAVHGRGFTAMKSVALRTSLPLLGALAGYKLGPSDLACGAQSPTEDGVHSHGGCSSGSLSGLIGGLLLGGVTAAVLDAKYLSTYEVKRSVPTWSANLGTVRGGGMTVGVAGSF